MDTSASRYCAYVGTYTNNKSKGIYTFNFDSATGRLELIGTASELINPSYICISQNSRFLYAVMEVEEFDGRKGGAVGAYLIDKKTGKLDFINMQPTNGKSPCQLCTDKTGKYLFTANYNEGTITEYNLGNRGEIETLLSVFRHYGSGPNKSRQEEPHVHYVSLTPDEKYLCAVDLGIDKINVYSFNQKNGLLTHEENLSVDVTPGSGPRHMTFSQDGRFAYLLTELSSEVIMLDMQPGNGTINKIQCISTLPYDFKGENYCAAIYLSGDYLYASNRGHDSIAIFKVTRSTGALEPVSIIHTCGEFPRDFAIDPTGRFLFAANQYSGTIVMFAIMPETGKLEQTGDIIEIPDPACIKFAPLV